MTICLITPPSVFLADEKVFPNLGILKVAAVLERSGHIVEHVDASGIQGYEQAVTDHAKSTTASLFGITATTPQMPSVSHIVRALREARPDARIILGGPHITLVCAALKKEKKLGMHGRATRAYAKLESMFDVLVAGDGEDAIFLAIQPDSPKYIDADNPAVDLFLTNERLNELPWPARHLIDMESYRYFIESARSYSLIGQLGCCFGCRFCGGRESPMLRRIRTRTTSNIVGEVRHLHDAYGAKGIMFYDDELNVSPAMIELMNGIADLQSEIGVAFKLRGFIKSQLFTDEQAKAMYRAGFRWILVGFESGSERILSNIRKKADRADNTRCMEIAHRHGLKVKALMSIGHAGESAETIQETKDWLLEVRPDDFDATCITVYPGTPYGDMAVQTLPNVWTFTCPENGDKLHSYEVDFMEEGGYYKGRVGDYRSFVYTDHLSSKELVKLRDELEGDVRAKLNIPFNPTAAARKYEHSMGQGLPDYILRTSNASRVPV